MQAPKRSSHTFTTASPDTYLARLRSAQMMPMSRTLHRSQSSLELRSPPIYQTGGVDDRDYSRVSDEVKEMAPLLPAFLHDIVKHPTSIASKPTIATANTDAYRLQSLPLLSSFHRSTSRDSLSSLSNIWKLDKTEDIGSLAFPSSPNKDSNGMKQGSEDSLGGRESNNSKTFVRTPFGFENDII